MLAAVTSARPKIADYPFTTLHPNLGVAPVDDEEFVLADIPGLIEGAHEGAGLGDRFLGHVERCRVLLHLVDGTEEDVAGRLSQSCAASSRHMAAGSTDKPEIVGAQQDRRADQGRGHQEEREALRRRAAHAVRAISGVAGTGLKRSPGASC